MRTEQSVIIVTLRMSEYANMLCTRFLSDRAGFAPLLNALVALIGFVSLLTGGGYLVLAFADPEMPVFLQNLFGI